MKLNDMQGQIREMEDACHSVAMKILMFLALRKSAVEVSYLFILDNLRRRDKKSALCSQNASNR